MKLRQNVTATQMEKWYTSNKAQQLRVALRKAKKEHKKVDVVCTTGSVFLAIESDGNGRYIGTRPNGTRGRFHVSTVKKITLVKEK